MDAIRDYLNLSPAYAQYLGGLRWSACEEGLERADEMFAYNEEVAQLVEGFGRGRDLIHFGFLLHLLDLLRNLERTLTPGLTRLRQTFSLTGRNLRNAGSFFAEVCRHVPAATGGIDAALVCDVLRNYQTPLGWFVSAFADVPGPGRQPPLEPPAFERDVLYTLETYDNEELHAWLRHGRGPVRGAGESLAERLPPARTLARVLTPLLDRPRLAGARAYVTQLSSALTLPGRQLDRPELPAGGYADVTTRGSVEQVLPSQFALEELDFFRRLAENELLFFRREEPHAPSRQELVVLLDQGVRTWGDVRLVLSAAVLALGRQAARRKTEFLVATTSSGGELTDPLHEGGETLGRLLEASDLSATPAAALERVLAQRSDGARDVVLLTHRRSLDTEDVRAAACRLAAGVRLFALALDGTGQAELAELRHGSPLRLGQFRIAFARSETVSAAPRGGAGDVPGPWSGAVEPIPFPFRLGLFDGVRLFDFDWSGAWLLTISGGGMLHAWRTDGGGMEVLPRPVVGSSLLQNPEAVLGVAGGFVVAGRLDGRLVVAHYDFASRRSAVYPFGAAKTLAWEWGYLPTHHRVFAVATGTGAIYTLELTSGTCMIGEDAARPMLRQAWLARTRGSVTILNHPPTSFDNAGPFSLYLDPDTGVLSLRGVAPAWAPFTPLADGRPVLRGCSAVSARYHERTLAVQVSRLGTRTELSLHVFRGPEGVPLAVYLLDHEGQEFKLSGDGDLLAWQVGQAQVSVRRLTGSARATVTTRLGGFPHQVELQLGRGWLQLRAGGRHYHLLTWARGPLLHRYSPSARSPEVQRELSLAGARSATADQRPARTQCDMARFVSAAEMNVTAVLDRFGQVAILDRRQELVCMFFAYRDQFAGWMPNGTRYGSAALASGAATPDAAEVIGKALREAEQAWQVKP
jgi:hypothetical protein